jgi:gas vesicle protein
MSNSTDPGSKSSAEIEREVEGTRARLTGTIEELKDRVSPGQVVEQAMDYIRGSGGQEFVANLGRQLRDNPLPILLIGTGIGWLMLSGRGGAEHRGVAPRPAPRRSGAPVSSMNMEMGIEDGPAYGATSSSSGRTAGAASSLRDSVSGAAAQAGEALAAARDTVADAASRAGAAVSEAWHGMSDRTGDATSRLTDRASGWAEQGYDTAGDLGESLSDILHRHPLVTGGIGLVIGAALGAVLPRSQAEDRLMGEASDEVASRVATLAERGYQQAKDTATEHLQQMQDQAGEVLGRVRERIGEGAEAPRQGADALGRMARDVREAVEDTAGRVAGQARDAASGGQTPPPG